jgi:hypothetical protein
MNLGKRAVTCRENLVSFVEKTGAGYHSGARLRTLNGLLIEEDLSDGVRLSEKIERLYLWTWRFLVRPETGALEKILLLQQNIRQNADTLSGEDYELLDLSVRWLGLFFIPSPSAHLIFSSSVMCSITFSPCDPTAPLPPICAWIWKIPRSIAVTFPLST